MGQQLSQINRNISGLREDRSILQWSFFQAFEAEWFLRLFDIYRHCFFQWDLMRMTHYCSFIETWSVYCLFCILMLHQFFCSHENTECRVRTTANYIFGKRNLICSGFCGMRKGHLNLLECHNSHSLWKASQVKISVIITICIFECASVFEE